MRKLQVLILLLVIIALGNSIFHLARKYQVVREAHELAREKRESLEIREQSLLGAISELGTARGREAIIREKFGLVRPGERVINLLDVGATSTATTSKPSSALGRFWGKIRSILD